MSNFQCPTAAEGLFGSVVGRSYIPGGIRAGNLNIQYSILNLQGSRETGRGCCGSEATRRRFPLAKDAEGAKNGWAGRGLLGDLGALGERILRRGSEIRSRAETRRTRRIFRQDRIRGAAGRPKGADYELIDCPLGDPFAFNYRDPISAPLFSPTEYFLSRTRNAHSVPSSTSVTYWLIFGFSSEPVV